MPEFDIHFVREMLCEGQQPRSSCGTNHKVEPLICVQVETCSYHASPCMKCLDAAVPLLSDAGAAASSKVAKIPNGPAMWRLPDDEKQHYARMLSHERVRVATQVLGGLLAVTILVAIVIVFRRARKQSVPRIGYALLSFGIIGTGAATWRYQQARSDQQRVAEAIDQKNVGSMRTIHPRIPNGSFNPAGPPEDELAAEDAALQRLLDAKMPGWQARAIDAGAIDRY
jgi:hypothetical protein